MVDDLSKIEKALILMLRPVVRLWIRRGEKLQHFVDVLKIVFVEVASDEISSGNNKVTASRINTVSGVHRTDVSAILKADSAPPQNLPSLAQRVIGFWEQSDDYRSSDGKRLVLDYEEFEELVAQVSTSVGARAVLFELERCGAVRQSRGGYRLVNASLKHTRNIERSINMVARNVDTMFEAAEENIEEANEIPNLMLRTEYDNVFLTEIPKVRRWLEREGKKFHKRARDFIGKYDADLTPSEGKTAGGRVVLGAFSLTDEAEDKAP